jgi:hypothetical protein
MKPVIAATAVAVVQGVFAVADGRSIGAAIMAGIFFFGLTWVIARWMTVAKKAGTSPRKLVQEDIPLWRGTRETPLRDR